MQQQYSKLGVKSDNHLALNNGLDSYKPWCQPSNFYAQPLDRNGYNHQEDLDHNILVNFDLLFFTIGS